MASKIKYSELQPRAEEFVRTWTRVYRQGGTMADIASELGMKTANARAKAKNLRPYGVNLPRFRRSRIYAIQKRYDISRLNDIIQEELDKR
jgi:hypothetical protein